MRWTIVLVAVVLVVGSEGRKHHKHGNKHDKKQADHDKHGEMTGHDQHAKPEGTGVHWKKHKPVDASADTEAKEQWMRMTHYHKSDDDACETMICKKHHVCVVDAATGAASCVHKRQIRQRNHRSKHHKKSDKKEHIDQKKLKKMKEQAHAFKAKYDKTLKKKHGHIKTAFDYMDTKPHKKAALTAVDHNMLLGKNKVCTSKELEGMGRRLLDWFHLLMTQQRKHKGKGHKKHDRHHKQKRNSKKKDLRDDACTCQSSVSWEFNQLDRNADDQLSPAELDDIENNGYEHCVKPFFDGCDHDNNKMLAHQEWCCCFADVLPPCLAAQRKVPDTEEEGVAKIMPGMYIPDCDEHGYYKQVQCHSSTGQCWCADRNGQEVYGTRTRSKASLQCEKHVARRHPHRKTHEGGQN